MMAISTLSEVTGYAFRAQTASADLTAPPNPAPVTLPAGSTALGSTLIGSWSAPVAVVATCTTGSGAPGPAVAVTGSGAGPYSISIASGLTTATSYIVTLAGTAADGQVAETCLLVVVAGVTTDLTAPATPSPVSLSAGSTALGSTLIGSWSASVTVAALVIPRSGPAPTATVTGSGAGPYSVSIASGLSDGGSYLVILTGTAADGQVASTSLLVAVATPADLTAPLPPPPVSLAAGSTSLGSTAIGSWSAAVTVTANVSGSDGSSPVATVTGSGAGPYSVSIASGLTDGVTYAVTLSGTGADGQVARVGLSVAVRTPATVVGTVDWVVAADYDFTTATTSGPYSAPTTITLGGSLPNLTLAQDLGGTYSVTPTNGTGIVCTLAGTGRPYLNVPVNWAALGIDVVGSRGFAVELIATATTFASTGGFLTLNVGTLANSANGNGIGTRLVGGTNRVLAVRQQIAGTGTFVNQVTQASDYANVGMLSGFYAGGPVGATVGTTPPASPAGYPTLLGGITRTPAATAPLDPLFLTWMWGNAACSFTVTRLRIWKLGVV
jgi:hypothetical protein